jgi:hypothetical protein
MFHHTVKVGESVREVGKHHFCPETRQIGGASSEAGGADAGDGAADD